VRLVHVLDIRKAMVEIHQITEQRDRCKEAADVEGLEAAQKTLKSKHIGVNALCKRLTTQYSDELKVRWLKKWKRETPTLAELLDDGGVDKHIDFPDVPQIVKGQRVKKGSVTRAKSRQPTF
jgi:hypothetical protein